MFEETFRLILHDSGVGETAAENLWKEIAAQYSEAGRYYHTLAHLDQMMASLLPVQEKISNWVPVVLATAYHDIIYNPLRDDNEEQSALLARERLEPLFGTEMTSCCCRLIRATKHHEQTEEEDAAYFLDADLSVLGSDAAGYERYASNIRREYALIPDELYRKGREAVLNSFLSRPRIYTTPWFYKGLEVAARQNIGRELKALSHY